MSQLRRICTPKPTSGKLEVPAAVSEKFKRKGSGRDELLKLLEQCGGDKARFIICPNTN